MSRTRLTLLSALALTLVAGCSAPESDAYDPQSASEADGVEPPLDPSASREADERSCEAVDARTVEDMEQGEWLVRNEEISVVVLEVLDTRCPEDGVCAHAGAAVVKVDVLFDGAWTRQSLVLDLMPSARFEDGGVTWEVELTDVLQGPEDWDLRTDVTLTRTEARPCRNRTI